MMTNTDYYFMLSNEVCSIGISYLTDEGQVHFIGVDSDIRKMQRGNKFEVKRKNNDVVVISGEITCINSTTVYNPVTYQSDNASIVEMEIQATCNINYCEWFIPI